MTIRYALYNDNFSTECISNVVMFVTVYNVHVHVGLSADL